MNVKKRPPAIKKTPAKQRADLVRAEVALENAGENEGVANNKKALPKKRPPAATKKAHTKKLRAEQPVKPATAVATNAKTRKTTPQKAPTMAVKMPVLPAESGLEESVDRGRFYWRKLLDRNQKKRVAWLLVLAVALAALYVIGLDGHGVFDDVEARHAEIAREIVHYNTLEFDRHTPMTAAILPIYNGMPQVHVPPLVPWLQAGLMHLLGEKSLLAIRLPDALAALGMLLTLGWWMAKVTGKPRVGLLAATVLGTSGLMMLSARVGTGAMVGAWMSLACTLTGLSLLYANDKKSILRWGPFAMGGMAALGLMAQGPLNWLPTVMVVAMVLLARRVEAMPNRMMLWHRLNPWLIGSVTLFCLLPWLFMMMNAGGMALLRDFLLTSDQPYVMRNMAVTTLQAWMIIGLGFLPWIFIWPQAVLWGRRRGLIRLSATRLDHALPAVAGAWGVVFAMIYLLSGWHDRAIALAMLPPAAMSVALWLENHLPTRRVETSWYGWRASLTGVPGFLGGVALSFVGLGLLMLRPMLEAMRLPELTGLWGWLHSLLGFNWPPENPMLAALMQQTVVLDEASGFAGVLMLVAVVPAYIVLWHLPARRRGFGLVVLALCWGSLLGMLAWGALPTVWRYTQAPLHELAVDIQQAPPGIPVIYLGVEKPSVLFHSQQFYRLLESPLQLPDYLLTYKTMVLIPAMLESDVRQEINVLTNPSAKIVGQHCKGGYCLLTIQRH